MDQQQTTTQQINIDQPTINPDPMTGSVTPVTYEGSKAAKYQVKVLILSVAAIGNVSIPVNEPPVVELAVSIGRFRVVPLHDLVSASILAVNMLELLIWSTNRGNNS